MGKTLPKRGNGKQVLSGKNISIEREIYKMRKNGFINEKKSGKI